MTILNWLPESVRNLRYGVRQVSRQPVFTTACAVVLGVGIGASTAMFSFVNSVILRPLPIRNPHNLVVLAGKVRGASHYSDFSYPDFLDYQSQSKGTFSDLAAYMTRFTGFSVDGRADQVFTSYVSQNFFSFLGLQPYLGRLIEPHGEENVSSTDPVAVLSYAYWQRRFNSDPSVVGKGALVNGRPVTILGVAPRGFHGAFAFMDTDIFTPMSQVVQEASCSCTVVRGPGDLRILGRLSPNISRQQAEANLQVIAARLAAQYPTTNKNLAYEVFPETMARPQADAAAIWPFVVPIAMTLAFLLLVLTCANVAMLHLARANGRQTEFAMRLALGSTRSALSRQMVIENLLLALPGGFVGIFLALAGSRALSSMSHPVDYPTFGLDMSFDHRVYLFSLSLVVLVGVVMGLVSVRAAWRSNLSSVLHEGSGAVTSNRRSNFKRGAIVSVQLAASTVLVFATGLFIHTLINAENMNLGFDPHNILNVTMDVSQGGYDQIQGEALYARLHERVSALPGVTSASYAATMPFASGIKHSKVYIEGMTLGPGLSPPVALYNAISPDYFATMRIRVLQGRGFNSADNPTTRSVAIVNQSMARRYWGDKDPIGKRFRIDATATNWLEVVGVVTDANYLGPFSGIADYYYIPISQTYVAERTLQIRTSVPPQSLAPTVRQEIQIVTPNVPVSSILTMGQQLQGINGLYLFHISAKCSAALGMLGLILAVVGVYGVLSHETSRRKREIAVRKALGATDGQIMRMIMLGGLRLVSIGAGAGIMISLALGVALHRLLPSMGIVDPWSLIPTLLAITCAALMACYIPAHRATSAEITASLRCE